MNKKLLIAISTSLILTIISVFIFLKTPFAKERVRLITENIVQNWIGREVFVGEITGDLLSHIIVNGVSIANGDDLGQGKFAEVSKLEIRYSLLDLFRKKIIVDDLIMEEPRLYIQIDEKGNLNVPEVLIKKQPSEPSRFRLAVILGNMFMSSGKVIINDKRDKIDIFINGVEGKLENPTLEEGQFVGKVSAKDSLVVVNKTKSVVKHIELQLGISGDVIELPSLAINLDRSVLNAKVKFISGKVPYLSLSSSAKISITDFENLLPKLNRSEGDIALYISANGYMPNIKGTCKINSKEIRLNDLIAKDIRALSSFNDRTVNFNGAIKNICNGNVQLKLSAGLNDGKLQRYQASLSVKDLDSLNALTAVTGAPSPISGIVSADLKLEGSDLKLGAFNAKGQIGISKASLATTYKGQDQVQLGDTKISLSMEGPKFKLFGSMFGPYDPTMLSAEGTISNSGVVKVKCNIDNIDLNKLSLASTCKISLLGKGALSADISMGIADPYIRKNMGLPSVPVDSELPIKQVSDLSAEAQITFPDMKLLVKSDGKSSEEQRTNDVSLGSMNGKIKVSDADVEAIEITINKGESSILVNAQGKIKDPPILSADVKINSLRITDYAHILGSNAPIHGGTVNGEIKLTGIASNINGNGQVSITDLKVSRRSFQTIDIPIQITDNVIEIPNLVLATYTPSDRNDTHEQVTFSLRFEPSGDYKLNIRSSEIDIGMLYSDFVAEAPPRPDGKMVIRVYGEGNTKLPKLNGEIELIELGFNGEKFGDAKCTFKLSEDKAQIEFGLSNQSLMAELSSLIKEPFPFKASMLLKDFDAEPMLRIAKLGDRVDLKMTGNVSLNGEAKNPIDSTVDVTIQDLLIGLDKYQWSNTSPIKVELLERELRLNATDITGEAGRISVTAYADLDRIDVNSISKVRDIEQAKKQLIDIDVRSLVKVEDLDMSLASSLLEVPVKGRLNCFVTLNGNARSPVLGLQIDMSAIEYDKLLVDSITGRVSYKDKTFGIEDLVVKALGGKIDVSAQVPMDLDIMNLPNLNSILKNKINLSVNSNGLDLCHVQPLVSGLSKLEGKLENIRANITGSIDRPNIELSIDLKGGSIELDSTPVQLTNINAEVIVRNAMETVASDLFVPSDDKYELSFGASWNIDKGFYQTSGLLKIDRNFINSEFDLRDLKSALPRLIADLKTPRSDIIYPEMYFEMRFKDGQVSPFVRSMLEDKLQLPIEGTFSGELQISGSIDNPRASVVLSELNIDLNSHRIRNHEPISFILSDRTVNVIDFNLFTYALGQDHSKKEGAGNIYISGRAGLGRDIELTIYGNEIQPRIASFLENVINRNNTLQIKKGQSSQRNRVLPSLNEIGGHIGFSIALKGNFKSPNVNVSIFAKDITAPMRSEVILEQRAKIDKVLLDIVYDKGEFQIRDTSIVTLGNEIKLFGKIPVELSLYPFSVVFPERDMHINLKIDKFDLHSFVDFIRPVRDFKGIAEADIKVTGNVKDPNLSGYLRVTKAKCALSFVQEPPAEVIKKVDIDISKVNGYKMIDIDDITLDVLMNGKSIDLNEASFKIGDGHYKANGKVTIGPSLRPQIFEIYFETDPAKIDPFTSLLNSKVALTGHIKMKGEIKADLQDIAGKSISEVIRRFNGSVSMSPEGVLIEALGHKITNQRAISIKLSKGRLDVPSFRLVDTSAKPSEATSISAFGVWNIDGESSFDATIYIDTSFISELLGRPGTTRGRLGIKMEARGNEVQVFWPPKEDSGKGQKLVFQNAVVDKLEGRISIKDQIINIDRIWVLSANNMLNVTGIIPIDNKPMHVQVDARMNDLGILSLVNKDIIESAGKGRLSVTVSGSFNDIIKGQKPITYKGFCTFEDLDANFERSYLKFEDTDISISFDSSRNPAIKIAELKGRLNDGDFVLDTSLDPGIEILWDKDTGYKIGEFKNISLTLRNCTFYQPQVYSVTVDADQVRLRRNYDSPLLSGSVIVKSGEYIESLQNLINELFTTREIGTKASLEYPLIKNLELDFDVQVPGNMRMINEVVNAMAEATARVRGSLADPKIKANARIIEGQFSYFGRKFIITKGDIVNESRIDPNYEIIAETEVENVQGTGIDSSIASSIKVQLEIKGSLSERVINLSAYSSGSAVQQKLDLSQSQIISLLTWGTSEALLSSAFSTSSPLLMEPTKWFIESQARRLLRLKDFQLRSDPRDSRKTRIIAVKEIGEQISVEFDFGYTGQQWVGLQREVGGNFALGGKVSPDGQWGLELKLKQDFP